MALSPSWKVLLIGGGTGTGKSTLAAQLGRHFDVGVIEGDDLRHAAEAAVPDGADPSLHIFRTEGFWSLPSAENVARTLGWARRLCEVAEPVIARRHFVDRPVIFEAVWVLPEFASRTTFDGVSMRGEVRSLFLHEDDPKVLRARALRARWRTEPAARPAAANGRPWEFARILNSEAREAGLPVLESRPFDSLFERALVTIGDS